MRSPAVLLATAATFFPIYALQLPFTVPFISRGASPDAPRLQVPAHGAADATIPNRVAILGAGAGGSSAAFWIEKAKERYGLDVDVDVYDKNSYIGGRSTTVYPYNDEALEPVELGASIFVQVNRNLMRAVDEFDLHLLDSDDDDEGEDEKTGVWDGRQFTITIGDGGWLEKVKILLRYGYSAATKTDSLVTAMIDRFLTLYQSPVAQWANISSITSQLGWSDLVAQTTSEYFDVQGVNKLFTREMIEGSTRVNYGQNVDQIHALEGLCSMAADGATGVKGGNFQLFEKFVAASKATVFLNTTVLSVTRRSPNAPWEVRSTASDTPRLYRSIVLAAPYHQTGIKFSTGSTAPLAHVPPQPYVHLHVTLLSTSATPDPSYFHLGPKADVPLFVLTTHNGVRRGDAPEPEFNSLSYHGPVRTRTGARWLNKDGVGERVVKIFSKERVDDAWLHRVFRGKVGWVLRKEWEAYPQLPPTTVFPPVKLAEGLYYVNAFEPLISTMETETIASRNVVDLLLREQFDAGICKPEEATPPSEQGEGFVYGWDC